MTGETKFFIGVLIFTAVILAGAVFFLSRPAPVLLRSELIPQDASTKGAKDAATYLVEFSDFQCPACKTFKPAVDELTLSFKDKMTFSYRHFPLSQHPFSLKAAKAFEAAGRQGKFWEMYDLLFENQDNLSDGLFTDLAVKLNLDASKFNKDMNDPSIDEKIQNDRSYGDKIGIDSTPTFYLNGQKISPSSSQDLKNLVEKSIKSSK